MSARALLASLVLLAACAAPAPVWEPSWSRSASLARYELVHARALSEAGDLLGAWRLLGAVERELPDDVGLAAWSQDLELALLAGDGPLPEELAPEAAAPDPADALRRRYARRVEAAPEDSAALVLAARLESDALAAENLLDRALVLDPGSAWAHYGRAHAILRQPGRRGRWETAHEALDRALELDPGLVPARRLEAWMAAEEGAAGPAGRALRVWLEQTRDDPRVARAERVRAEIDLAILWILNGHPGAARDLLVALEGGRVDRERRLAALAVADRALGDDDAALDAARRAQDAAPEELLPSIQEALLYQYGLGDREAARERWRDVVRRSEGQADLAKLLQGLRARVVLEEMDREEAAP